MNLLSPSELKNLLSKYETRPSKGLGQNFLIDERILEKIVASANIRSTDTILEVGPGMGVLTQELAKKAKKVIAIEKDQTMVEILNDVLNASNVKNVEIVPADILQANIQNLTPNTYKLVANIPYYLTSPLIRKFLECNNPPQEIILMIQKEVAQRICARAGEMSLLSVSVQFYANAKIVSHVSKNCFWPSPKIDSAIIKIVPEKKYAISPDLFFTVVKAGFSQPRKQLVNNLTTLKTVNSVKLNNLSKEQVAEWLLKNNLKPNQRAETLTIQDWVNLTKSLEKI